MGRYAANTEVGSERSRAEIERTLTRYGATSFMYGWDQAGALAGVEDVIAHRFRHLYATTYLTMHPGDEIGLRRLLGHVGKQALADYAHLSQLALHERAVNAMPSRYLLDAK